MPPASDKTAWDFLPQGWAIRATESWETGCAGHGRTDATWIRCEAPEGFEPITQLEHARVGTTPGIDFGEAGEGMLRFCYAVSEATLESALERLAATVPALEEACERA